MKIKVPYALTLLFPVIGWSILCSIFAYFLIITIANFEEPAAERAFLVMTPIFTIVFAVWSFLRYSGIGFLADNNIKLINKNVTIKGIAPNLSTEEIKDTFNALAFICKGSAINVLASGLSVVVLVILTEWFNLASNFEMLIIMCGGAIALFFSCAFAAFFCQQAMFPAIKECRRILMERDDKIDKMEYSGIGGKFFFLFFLPFFTILTVLLAVRPFNFNVAIICLISLGMTFVIDRVLLVYLTSTLKELETFAVELPKGGERAVFITGSLDREVVNLSQSLNEASEKMYGSKSELERSQEEMAKRVNELEKFFELTVNREVKMVELKKELKKYKGDVQEDDA